MTSLNPIAGHSLHRPSRDPWTLGFRILFALGLFVLTFEGLTPSHSTVTPIFFDKVMHFGAFFILAGLWMLAAPRLPLKHILWVLTVYGGAIELLQGLMGWGRTASFFDGIANLLGVLAAIGLWVLCSRLIFGRKRAEALSEQSA